MDELLNVTKENFDLILNLIKDETLIVKWTKQGFSLRIIKEDILNTLKKEDREKIIKSIFNLFKNIRRYLEDKEIDKEYISYIQTIIHEVDYIKENFIIYKNSNAYILDEHDYEIITKRDKNKIDNIIGYSALLSLKAFHATDSDKTKSLTFDISEHDLDELIQLLVTARESIQILKEKTE